jgi:hypothetical protein
MWSGIQFNVSEIVNQATSLTNVFMPLVYIIGGIAIFGLIIVVLISVAKR